MADKNVPGPVGNWQVDWDKAVAETRVFTLRKLFATSPSDPSKRGDFVYLDAPDWVNVIALTADNEVVLIEQFRHGIAEVTLEVPGGSVDPGEEPLPAGLRELREETGYEGENAEVIGTVAPNPAIINNRCHTVLVRDVKPLHDAELEGFEEIHTRLAPLDEVPGLIGSGAITHSLVIAAFYHLHLRDGS